MGPSDTDPLARHVQIKLLREAGTTKRAALALRLSASVISMSRRALREQMPSASDRDVLLRWAALHYGQDLS
ncbi:MAG TPA: hypothetical protein VNO21_21945, partial [Polyangiaceae bacterium]|nr:hypothetical protein [Polyangiaceae bacterium]